MSKNELLNSVSEIVENMFSSYEMYDNVKEEAIKAYDEYIKLNNKDESFEILIDFLIEYAMKHSIEISMKETINLLCDTGVLHLND